MRSLFGKTKIPVLNLIDFETTFRKIFNGYKKKEQDI